MVNITEESCGPGKCVGNWSQIVVVCDCFGTGLTGQYCTTGKQTKTQTKHTASYSIYSNTEKQSIHSFFYTHRCSIWTFDILSQLIFIYFKTPVDRQLYNMNTLLL